jgi:putative membrane protein
MKTSFVALTLLSLAAIVHGQSLTPPEREFVQKAAAGNTAEVKLAQLAQQKSQDAKVKDFANLMITDHGKANNDLKPIADAANIKISDQLKGDAKVTYNELEKLSGSKFDHRYVSAMVRDHRKDAAEYQKAQSFVKNPQLKTYVDNTLPIVQHHLTMAEGMENKTAAR